MRTWFSLLSTRQRLWLILSILIMTLTFSLVSIMNSPKKEMPAETFTTDMSIRDIAPKLEVTGRALARELGLDLDASKRKQLKKLGIKNETLEHAVEHLLSHKDSTLKYYVFAALVLWGLVFLVKLGRPERSDIKNKRLTRPLINKKK